MGTLGSVLIWFLASAQRVAIEIEACVYKAHFPSKCPTFWPPKGLIISREKISAFLWPLLSFVYRIVTSPHFDICRGTSNVQVKSLTFRKIVPDITSAFVSISGICKVKELISPMSFTSVLDRLDSPYPKLIGSSLKTIRTSRSFAVPIFHVEEGSDLSCKTEFELVWSKNRIQAFHSNRSWSAFGNRGVMFDCVFTIKTALADAYAMGFFMGSFFHSENAEQPANITSTETPVVTRHSPQNPIFFERLNWVMFLNVSL